MLGPHGHPEVSLHTHSLAKYVACLERGDWAGVGELMLASAEKLARIGADFLICPDNTVHKAMPLVEKRSPRPYASRRPRRLPRSTRLHRGARAPARPWRATIIRARFARGAVP